MTVSSITTDDKVNKYIRSEVNNKIDIKNSFKYHIEKNETENDKIRLKGGRPQLMKLTIEEEQYYNKVLKDNGFEPLTETEKRQFDYFLEDHTLDNIELFRLDFKQAKKINFIASKLHNFPILGNFMTGSAINVVSLTKDDKFNKALFETLKTMTGNGGMDAFMFKNQVEQNIFQLVDGKKLEASFAAHSYNRKHNITKVNLNINFDEFIKKMLLHIDNQLLKKLPSSIRDQYDQMRNGYVALEENYNKIKNTNMW